MARHETASPEPARRGTRADRLGFRVDATTKHLIERAAGLERRKITDYCVDALAAAARHTIEEHDRILLSERDRELVFDALMNPPEANERLKRAFEARRSHVTL